MLLLPGRTLLVKVAALVPKHRKNLPQMFNSVAPAPAAGGSEAGTSGSAGTGSKATASSGKNNKKKKGK